MAAIVLSLLSSASWGIADFLGGLCSRRLPLLTVLLVVQFSGLVAIVIVLAARGVSPPGAGFVPPALAAAALGIVGLAALYRGLAVGVMSVVAPIAATGAVVSVIAGLALGERPTPLQNAGIAVALAGVVLASRSKSSGDAGVRRATGAGLGIAAALMFGSFFVVFDVAAEEDPYWAVLVLRAASTALVATAALAVRAPVRLATRDKLVLPAVGLLDLGGNAFFAVASTRGLLGVVSVLTSLYPVVTVLLARAVLAERLTPAQALGAAGALAGVGLIATG